ncbi:MAG: class I SAM-dependent methyltransferase, partial [Endomicrobiales bacterium]
NISYLIITPNVTQGTEFSDQVYASLVHRQSELLSQSLPPVDLSQAPLQLKVQYAAQALFPLLVEQKLPAPELSRRMNEALSRIARREGVPGKVSFSLSKKNDGSYACAVTCENEVTEFTHASPGRRSGPVPGQALAALSAPAAEAAARELEGAFPFWKMLYALPFTLRAPAAGTGPLEARLLKGVDGPLSLALAGCAVGALLSGLWPAAFLSLAAYTAARAWACGAAAGWRSRKPHIIVSVLGGALLAALAVSLAAPLIDAGAGGNAFLPFFLTTGLLQRSLPGQGALPRTGEVCVEPRSTALETFDLFVGMTKKMPGFYARLDLRHMYRVYLGNGTEMRIAGLVADYGEWAQPGEYVFLVRKDGRDTGFGHIHRTPGAPLHVLYRADEEHRNDEESVRSFLRGMQAAGRHFNTSKFIILVDEGDAPETSLLYLKAGLVPTGREKAALWHSTLKAKIEGGRELTPEEMRQVSGTSFALDLDYWEAVTGGILPAGYLTRPADETPLGKLPALEESGLASEAAKDKSGDLAAILAYLGGTNKETGKEMKLILSRQGPRVSPALVRMLENTNDDRLMGRLYNALLMTGDITAVGRLQELFLRLPEGSRKQWVYALLEHLLISPEYIVTPSPTNSSPVDKNGIEKTTFISRLDIAKEYLLERGEQRPGSIRTLVDLGASDFLSTFDIAQELQARDPGITVTGVDIGLIVHAVKDHAGNTAVLDSRGNLLRLYLEDAFWVRNFEGWFRNGTEQGAPPAETVERYAKLAARLRAHLRNRAEVTEKGLTPDAYSDMQGNRVEAVYFVNPRAVEWAKTHKLEFRQGDVFKLRETVPEKSVDAAIAANLLGWSWGYYDEESTEQAVREIGAALREEGILIVGNNSSIADRRYFQFHVYERRGDELRLAETVGRPVVWQDAVRETIALAPAAPGEGAGPEELSGGDARLTEPALPLALGLDVPAVMKDVRRLNPLLARLLVKPSLDILRSLGEKNGPLMSPEKAAKRFGTLFGMLRPHLAQALRESGAFAPEEKLRMRFATLTDELMVRKNACILASMGFERQQLNGLDIVTAIFSGHQVLWEYLMANGPPEGFSLDEWLRLLAQHEASEYVALTPALSSAPEVIGKNPWLPGFNAFLAAQALPRNVESFHRYLAESARSLLPGQEKLLEFAEELSRQPRLIYSSDHSKIFTKNELQGYRRVVIKEFRLNSTGALWLAGRKWARFDDRAGEEAELHLTGGFITGIVFPSDGTGEEFARVVENATGKIIDTFRGGLLPGRMKGFKDVTVKDFRLTDKGWLEFGGKAWARFEDRPGEKADVLVKDGVAVKVTFRKDGSETDFLLLEDNASGRVTDSFLGRIPSQRMKELDNVTVRNVNLSANGVLELGGRIWTKFDDRPNEKVDVLVRNGLVTKVFFTRDGTEGSLLRFVDAATGLTFDTSGGLTPGRLKDLKDAAIKNLFLNGDGNLRLFSRTWELPVPRPNEKVEARVKDGVIHSLRFTDGTELPFYLVYDRGKGAAVDSVASLTRA